MDGATAMSEFSKDQERFKKLKREEFPDVENKNLINAATAWVYGKTQVLEPSRHLEILVTLPMPCQYLIAVNAIDGELNNGGFIQYYFNLSHILTVTGAEALSAIGAPRLAEIAKRADLAYLQIKDDLGNFRNRTIDEFPDYDIYPPLNDLEEEYYAVSEIERVDDLLIAYIRRHIDCFGD